MKPEGLRCRFCDRPLEHVFVDLGMSPLANSNIEPDRRLEMEPFFPLCTYVCEGCFLVQLPEFQKPDQIFSDYAYFSSYSDSWLEHARRYCELVVGRFGLGAGDLAVEIASNDGYLLTPMKGHGLDVLGVEPAANVAAVAEKAGIPSLVRFFGCDTARHVVAEHRPAKLLIGNNVLAHVPDINDFVGGLKIALAEDGVVTMEFPHLLQLMHVNQFDTIYHEHFSYLSFGTVSEIFAAHGLEMFDVEELPTHGGSLRIYAQHAGGAQARGERAEALLQKEEAAGLRDLDGYLGAEERVRATKRSLLRFLIEAAEAGKSVVGYGAPAKGNTLLNYCGVGPELLAYTVDRSPHKQGRWLPGTSIPIYGPEKIAETRPDYVLILPWNLKDEICSQMAEIAEWGGRFVVAIPDVEVLDA